MAGLNILLYPRSLDLAWRHMSNPSISVAMATFNGARYLDEQLTSLASQTVKPLELVVCDDGSSDETVKILRSFSAGAPFPVTIVENGERLGYQKNFLKATSLCKGAFIAFCDQDDVWNNDKLFVVDEYFLQSDDLLVAHDYCVIFEDGRSSIPSYFSYLALSGILPVVSIKGCSLVFRRELIKLVDLPPRESKWSHDLWFCFTALLLEKRGYIRQSLIRHRIHGNNTSGWLMGGKADLRLWLRRFRLPPFTGSTDLDEFIAEFVGPKDLDVYCDVVRQCEAAMTENQRERALSSLAKRRSICNFIISKAYLRVRQRTFGAIGLFLGGAYRSGGGMLGLIQDVLGRRSWMR